MIYTIHHVTHSRYQDYMMFHRFTTLYWKIMKSQLVTYHLAIGSMDLNFELFKWTFFHLPDILITTRLTMTCRNSYNS